ncbi:WD40-repeat-containing domain protein [Cokeromyces recurvatus]|uniref:WD40-repeat-containing domain protein n=1 Tax=Cokeromyces recurvatus TaxID=90255 RepID=UPI002220C18F|nr:WD40-repeat-containing domain protein [Cokeromyces recurvatus]KAI7904101.1 WD40-repeat-containing domain protein [Cokeromyces recurvatus]
MEHSEELESEFQIPEYMSGWTDKQKAEFAFQLLKTLPSNEVVRVVDQISPHLRYNILLQLPHEIAIYILSFLDVYSLIQASQVSKGWHSICMEQSLWRNLFELENWTYNQAEMNAYLNYADEEYDNYQNITVDTNTNNNVSEKSTAAQSNISPVPISRTSSPLLEMNTWSRLYMNNNKKTIENDRGGNSHSHVTRDKKRNTALEKMNSHRASNTNYHYNPVTDTRFINWQKLYQNRFTIERRWKEGSCVTRMFPPLNCPVSDIHTDGIYCIQFDKNIMVTGSRDMTVKVWDMRTGQCKMTMRGHDGSVLCLQYDKNILVTGSSDSNIFVTDMKTGEIKKRLIGHRESVLCVKMVTNNRILSCSKDGSLRLWNRLTGECIRVYTGHNAAVNALQWKGNRIVSGSGDRTIKIWDLETGTCLQTLTAHTRGVACVEFDGNRIVSGSSDQTIKVWNAATGECIYTLVGHTELVRTIQLDPIANRIISGCYDGRLKIWSLDEGRLLRDLGQATEGRFDCTMIACSSNVVKVVIYDFAHDIDTKFLV